MKKIITINEGLTEKMTITNNEHNNNNNKHNKNK